MSVLLIDLRIAFMTLLEHRRRTTLLGAALAAVSALVVLLGALSAGVHHMLVDTATSLVSGHLNVGGFFKSTPSQADPVIARAADILRIARQALPEADYVAARGRGFGSVVSDARAIQTTIVGVDIGQEPSLRTALRVVSGHLDELAKPDTVVLFEAQAKKLNVGVGDALTLSTQTARGVANTADCRVVAIARDTGLLSQFTVFVSNASLRALYQLKPDTAGAIQIYLRNGHQDELEPLAARLRESLTREGYEVLPPAPRSYFTKLEDVTRQEWTGQRLDVTTWEDELSFMMWTVRTLDGLSRVLILLLLAILVMGITSTLWIAIRERTREIGALRAIGMQRGGVMRMFLFEAFMLAAVGGGAGAALGTLLSLALNAGHIHVPLGLQMFLLTDTLQLRVEPIAVARAVTLIAGVATLAALYPSYRAARLRPVEAMQHL